MTTLSELKQMRDAWDSLINTWGESFSGGLTEVHKSALSSEIEYLAITAAGFANELALSPNGKMISEIRLKAMIADAQSNFVTCRDCSGSHLEILLEISGLTESQIEAKMNEAEVERSMIFRGRG